MLLVELRLDLIWTELWLPSCLGENDSFFLLSSVASLQSKGDDSNDEEFSSSSEDDTEEEAEDDIDEEAKDDTEDDTDDETWNLKTIGTTSKKGATSSSSPSTKKTIVNRGEPVRHCILGLPNPKTYEMIRKKEF
ncbi:hypothetical protein Tco_0053380 [Tanacetum coccineum]